MTHNPCYFCMVIGHTARHHNVIGTWPSHLKGCWEADKNAWHSVKSLAEAKKTPNEIAKMPEIDITHWGPTSDIELEVDIAEASTGLVCILDKTKPSEAPKKKSHKWPNNMKPVLRKSGVASTSGGFNMGKTLPVSPPRERKKKFKSKGKRKFLGGASPVQDGLHTPEDEKKIALVPQSFQFHSSGHEERMQSLKKKGETICDDVKTLKEDRQDSKAFLWTNMISCRQQWGRNSPKSKSKPGCGLPIEFHNSLVVSI